MNQRTAGVDIVASILVSDLPTHANVYGSLMLEIIPYVKLLHLFCTDACLLLSGQPVLKPS